MTEKSISPVTALINLTLTRCELSIFLCADATVFWRPRPDFLTSIVIKVPTERGRGGVFPKKRRGKKVSRRIFFIPVNANPVSLVTCCNNIHSDWTACAFAA